MPLEKSYMINEPSMGPVPAQVIVKGATLTAAETASGADIKAITGEVITVPLTAATVSQAIFIADDTYQLVSASVVPEVIGGAGATITVERLTGIQAPGGGVAQLTAALVLNGVAHTVLNGVVKAAPDTLNPGDRLGIVMAGTLTGLVGVINAVIKRV